MSSSRSRWLKRSSFFHPLWGRTKLLKKSAGDEPADFFVWGGGEQVFPA
jgi:hypothetical protein